MRFGIIGGSYTARSSAIADEECINLFAETREASQAAAPAKMYGGAATGGTQSLLWTPGLSVFNFTPLFGLPRATCWTGSRLFAVAGNVFLEFSANGIWTALNTVVDDGNPASIAFNGLQLLIVSGGSAYCYTLASSSFVDVTPQLVGIPAKVEYDDTYAIIMFQNSNKAQLSNFNDWTTFPGLFVNEISVFPENISSIIANHREMWVFGERHAQVYQDTGSAEIFDVIPGAFIESGCVGPFVPCRVDNSVFWISEDERGGRMAWRSNGYTPQRISTYAVEIDLACYPTLFGMTTYSYQDGGHLFWVLYIPGSQWSWVYDVTEQMWHKRASWDEATATWGPHQSWNHVYAFGQHLVGDWGSGNLYTLSLNNFKDNGATIRRLRRAATAEDEMQWIYHSMLNLDFEMGNLTNVNPSDSPGYASWLLGPTQAVAAETVLAGGTAWSSPTHASGFNDYATCSLVPSATDTASSTSIGTSQGGGVAWTSPENIDDPGSFASVDLAAGGAAVVASDSGDIGNSASPSNQTPADVVKVLGGFPSTAATDATLYVVISGTVTASNGFGNLTLNYSKDGGATWTLARTWTATFANTTVPITITGITDLNSLKVQLIANCSCGPSGFANVTLSVPPPQGVYALVSGASQPISQTLQAAVTGLTIPAGRTIVGVTATFQGDYSGDPAQDLQVSLSVGNVTQAITLPNAPTSLTAGGSANLWGYDGWTADTFTTLKVNFIASSTGTTTVNLNTLVVSVHHVQTVTPSNAIDVTRFGFLLPTTSKLVGILISMRAFTNFPFGNDAKLTVQMLKAGVPVGITQTLPLAPGNAATTPVQTANLAFGGFNALFGQTWANSDVEASNFGVRVTVAANDGTTAQVFLGGVALQLLTAPITPVYNYQGPDPMLVDGSGNPRPPQAMVRWSDDRGKTWSNEHIVDLGMMGQYKVRAILRRLGRSRYRVYEVSMSDPVPWVLKDGYLDAVTA